MVKRNWLLILLSVLAVIAAVLWVNNLIWLFNQVKAI